LSDSNGGDSWRNFGLKSEGYQFKGERGLEARREENEEEVSCYSSDSGVWESILSSPSGVRGVVPAESGFIVI